MEPKIKAAEKAICLLGPQKLAKSVSKASGKLVTKQRVNNWRHRGVPPVFVRHVVSAVDGRVSAAELCPECFGVIADARQAS